MNICDDLCLYILEYIHIKDLYKIREISKKYFYFYTKYCNIHNIIDTYLLFDNYDVLLRYKLKFKLLYHNNKHYYNLNKNQKYFVQYHELWKCGENHTLCNGRKNDKDMCGVNRGIVLHFKFLEEAADFTMCIYVAHKNLPKSETRYILQGL